MPNNEVYYQNIRSKLTRLVAEVAADNKSNMESINIHAESFYREFLNTIFDWKLVNANDLKPNAKGIDLIYPDGKVVVQVSKTFTKQKIQTSLNHSNEYIGSHFYFVPISNDSKQFTAADFDNNGLDFNPKTDILTPAILCERIVKRCNIEKQKKLSMLVDRYFERKSRKFWAILISAVIIISAVLFCLIPAFNVHSSSAASTTTSVPSTINATMNTSHSPTTPDVEQLSSEKAFGSEENDTITLYRYGAWSGATDTTWCCKWDVIEYPRHKDYTQINTEWSTKQYKPEPASNGNLQRWMCGYGYDEGHPHQYYAGTLAPGTPYGKNNLLKDYWYLYTIRKVGRYWEETKEVPVKERIDVCAEEEGNVGNISYAATVYGRYRDANSIQLKIVWTSVLPRDATNSYSQFFEAGFGSVFADKIQVVNYDRWSIPSKSERFREGSTSWITVPLSTTDATSVDLHLHFYFADADGADISILTGTEFVDETWTITLPTF